MTEYFGLCMQYRILITEQRFNFTIERAVKIAMIYRQMEHLAYA